jgi:hypothetical protein
LAPINRDKVLDRIPSILKSHVDQVLLEKLEVRRFGDEKTKKGRGKKVPAGDSFSTREEVEKEEVVDQFSNEEMVSGSDKEMGVERLRTRSCLTLSRPGCLAPSSSPSMSQSGSSLRLPRTSPRPPGAMSTSPTPTSGGPTASHGHPSRTSFSPLRRTLSWSLSTAEAT